MDVVDARVCPGGGGADTFHVSSLEQPSRWAPVVSYSVRDGDEEYQVEVLDSRVFRRRLSLNGPDRVGPTVNQRFQQELKPKGGIIL